MDLQAATDWYPILDALAKEGGIALLLGATDTGKSSLAKHLVSQLCLKGIRTGLVDADIGQSLLGPPTTIGLSVFDALPDWDTASAQEIFFVGSTSPEGLFPLHVRGTRKMVDQARSHNAEAILVDTTGFIHGEAGRELKQAKIDLILPQFVITLQRNEEAEHILARYSNDHFHRIFRLKPSDRVIPRTWQERKLYRTNKFQQYFIGSEVRELPIEQVPAQGEIFALRTQGTLLGLENAAGDTLALGIAEEFREQEKIIQVLTPLRAIEKVKSIQVGRLRLSPSFEDERF